MLRPVLVTVLVLVGGCGGASVQQVGRWEQEGNLAGLRRALSDRDPAVRQAAAQVFVRYAAYNTCRPAMLATLEHSGGEEGRAAARSLFGQPPTATPDPDRPANVPADAVAIYLYRLPEKGPRAGAAWF